MIDVKDAIAKAKEELRDEQVRKAVAALKVKYKMLEDAKSVVANIQREVADLEASLGDGSFVA